MSGTDLFLRPTILLLQMLCQNFMGAINRYICF